MDYSTEIYKTVADLTVADLIETPRVQGQRSSLSDFDDVVIALSIDSGRDMDTVRARLIQEMSGDQRVFFAQRHMPDDN